MTKHILACLVIFSFMAVITADYWRSPNVISIVIVEIEPKKSNETRSDSSKELKQDLKEKLFVFYQAAYFHDIVRFKAIHQPHDQYSNPHLSSTDLPPELV